MKIFIAITFATAIAAAAVSKKKEGPTIPGNAGVKYCTDEDYHLTIDSFDIEPFEHLVPGQAVNVTAYGKAVMTIGARSHLTTVFRKGKKKYYMDTLDLCSVQSIYCGMEGNGTFDFNWELKVPDNAKPGKWHFEALFESGQNAGWKHVGKKGKKYLEEKFEPLACISGTVDIHKKK